MRTIVRIVPIGKYKARCILSDGGEAKLPAVLARTFLGKELPGEYTVEYPEKKEDQEHKEAALTVLKVVVPKEELERFTNFVG